MGSARKALAILTMAMVGGGAALVPALPAAASSSGCDFTMVSLKARDLHDSTTDYVWLKLNGDWFPNNNDGVAFSRGETHYPSVFGNPVTGFNSGGLDVSVVLDTWGISNKYVGTATITCSPVNDAVITFSGHNAMYDLTYDVS